MSNKVVIEDSYIHDLASEGNPATTGSHNEAILSNGGSNFVVRHNNLDGETSNATGALAFFGDFDPLSNATVEQNLFNGGGSASTEEAPPPSPTPGPPAFGS